MRAVASADVANATRPVCATPSAAVTARRCGRRAVQRSTCHSRPTDGRLTTAARVYGLPASARRDDAAWRVVSSKVVVRLAATGNGATALANRRSFKRSPSSPTRSNLHPTAPSIVKHVIADDADRSIRVFATRALVYCLVFDSKLDESTIVQADPSSMRACINLELTVLLAQTPLSAFYVSRALLSRFIHRLVHL